jgi:hypothetical protein
MRTRTIIVGMAITVAGLATAQPAAAEERTCRGTVGQVTVDNVRVPAGATCTLNGTRVQGTVYVNRHATLRAVGAWINGNVQAENARDVRVVQGSTVGGSYQVVQSGLARLFDSRVEGDVLIDENRRPNEIRRNRVGGNIQAFQNTGGVAIFRNTVDGNLQCKQNRPAPTGGGNLVHGSKEDQCRRF